MMDVAIIAPLQEEFDHLFARIAGSTPDRDRKTNRSYYRFGAPTQNGEEYKCVAAFIGDMGEKEAGYLTGTLLSRYEPATIALIGLAGSLSSDVSLGDVVVADQIADYMARAKASQKAGTYPFELSGKSYRPDVRLRNLLMHLKYDHKDVYERLVSESLDELKALTNKEYDGLLSSRLIRPQMALRIGPVASGDIVGASLEFARWLKERDRKFLALEMEAAGVMSAIYEAAGDERVLVMRGISDYSDERKDYVDAVGGGGLRSAAMRNAVRVLWALFEIGAFDKQSPKIEVAARKLPSSLNEAEAVIQSLDPAVAKEIDEIILLLELFTAPASHFERVSFLQRVGRIASDPVVMPKEFANSLLELHSYLKDGELDWKNRLLMRAAFPLFRKKLNAEMVGEIGASEFDLWARFCQREDAVVRAYGIRMLAEIDRGVITDKLRKHIEDEFHTRGWEVPARR